MQLLRTYRDDQPDLTQDGFAVLKAGLERQMAAAPVVRRARARRRGIAFGVIGAAAAACVVVGVVGAGPAPQASAAAARLLEGAASDARAAGDDGGSRTLVIREDALAMRSGDDGIDAAYVDRTITRLQVPAGRGEWARSRSGLPVTTFYGGAAARAFLQQDQPDASTDQGPVVERSRDGSFTVGELGGRNPDVFGADVQDFRQLPHDATALLKTFRTADLGAGEPTDEAEHVMEAASAVLESGVADADLQAATFAALQQQPGLAVTDRSADLDGRSGVAIGVPAAKEKTRTLQLILDERTGRYLGHREVTLVPIGVVPAGTVLTATAVDQP